MLRAHYNMPAADFIAQLRTYVIAMGLSPQVVDAVDNLVGAEDLERDHEKDLQEIEDQVAKEVKDGIQKAVQEWAAHNLNDETAKMLLAVIEET
jgi:hypothetical protein